MSAFFLPSSSNLNSKHPLCATDVSDTLRNSFTLDVPLHSAFLSRIKKDSTAESVSHGRSFFHKKKRKEKKKEGKGENRPTTTAA